MKISPRITAAVTASLLAVSCGGGSERPAAAPTETIATCIPERADIAELNVRSVQEAIDLSVCLAQRVGSEEGRELGAFLRRAVPVEVTLQETSAGYVSTPLIRSSGETDGLRIAFVGEEHAGSQDPTMQKLADFKHPAASELVRDQDDRPLLLLSHPRMVAPAVTAYGILHFGLHTMRESDCVQEEMEVLRFLSEVVSATDHRTRAWLQTLVTRQAVQTRLVDGVLDYSLSPQEFVPPPHVTDDRTPKSFMNTDLYQGVAMVVSAISGSPAAPAQREAQLRAEAGRHCPPGE